MIVRASFLLLALVSAIKVCQINNSRSRKPSTSGDKNEKATSQQEGIEKKNGKFEESQVEPRQKEEKRVKNGVGISAEQLNSRRPEFSIRDVKGQHVSEIDLLNNVVKEKENGSGNLEVRLIELYCLKEQQSRIALLQKQLMDKISEINMLSGAIDKLKAEKDKLCEEVKLNQLAEKQLESAKVTILELQRKRKLGAEQIEGHLMQLKKQVLEESQGPNKVDKKLRALQEVELKAMKMKRRNIELQLDKRELVVKLNAAKAHVAELSCMTQHNIVAKFQEEISRLKHTNNNLAQEVDKLHRERFSFLEELVYQRCLNKCLKFELEDYRSPGPKKIKPIDSNKLSFRSYSNSSEMSSVDGSDELTNTSTISSSSSDHSKKKRHGVIHSIKRWARGKDNSNANASESNVPQDMPGHIRRFSTSSIPSSILGLRNRGDSGVLFSSKNHESLDSSSPEKPVTRRARRVSFNDSINCIRYIYEDRPQSDQGTSDNSHKISESSSDCSGMKICSESSDSEAALERNKDELPSSTAKGEISEGKKAEMRSSAFPVQNQYIGTETLVVQRRQLAQAERLSSEMPDGASATGVSMFCDLLVNLTVGVLTLALFLGAFYFSSLA